MQYTKDRICCTEMDHISQSLSGYYNGWRFVVDEIYWTYLALTKTAHTLNWLSKFRGHTHNIWGGGGLGHVLIVYSWQAICDVSYLCPGLVQCHMEGQDTLSGVEWCHQIVSLIPWLQEEEEETVWIKNMDNLQLCTAKRTGDNRNITPSYNRKTCDLWFITKSMQYLLRHQCLRFKQVQIIH